jgi:transmembrane sensor
MNDNILDFETPESVEREAREWLIRLDGDAPLSASENQSFQRWVTRYPSHRVELERLSKFWQSANVLTELAVPLKRASAQTPNRARTFIVAASVILVSAIGVLWWWHADYSANGTYRTLTGQQQTIALPDGSSIELNTDSLVRVDYAGNSRTIRLLRGEALFSVAHSTWRPFDVYAGGTVVRAVGTAFSVQLAGGDVNVVVTKGVVDVAELATGRPNGGTNVPNAQLSRHSLGKLKAGQTTTFAGPALRIAIQDVPPPELERRLAWHDGYLVFSGESLSEVVRQVNRYSEVSLEIADPKLASIAVGGRFKIGDLDAVLDMLHRNFGIESDQIDDHNIRLGATRHR